MVFFSNFIYVFYFNKILLRSSNKIIDLFLNITYNVLYIVSKDISGGIYTTVWGLKV